MNYDEFKDYVIVHLAEWFPNDYYEIAIRKVVKNNGLVLDGLCIFQRGSCAAPTLYLESYYEQYKSGCIMAEILASIEREYRKSEQRAVILEEPDFHYETIREHIVLRLVNYDKNSEILKDCPYLKFHDLAITFRWLAHQDDIGISTSLISLREMERWQITVEQLYEDALRNTQRIFPSKILQLHEMVTDYGVTAKKGYFDLYVLSNEQGINGATCILYEGLLQSFAKEKDSSFYLLPSSIHEMMICLEEEVITEKMLLSLVRDANQMVVTMGEVLSDSIYYYSKRTGKLSVIKGGTSQS